MRRALVMVAALAVTALLIPVAPILAQTETATVVTVNATPPGGELTLGENLALQEFWLAETKLENGAVGPFPYYFPDLGYGTGTSCSFGDAAVQAQADNVDGWIAMTERGQCPGAYQQSVSSAEAAGASGLIFGNSEANAGAPVGPAAEGAQIAGGMVDYDDAQRMVNTRLGAEKAIEVRVTLQLLTYEVEEELPPRPEGYRPPESSGSGGFGTFGGDGFGDFGFGELGQGFDESAEDTEVITVPGPDGELIEIEIPVYAEDVAEEAGFNPLIPITVSVIVLGATLGFLFFVRARRNEDEFELGY